MQTYVKYNTLLWARMVMSGWSTIAIVEGVATMFYRYEVGLA